MSGKQYYMPGTPLTDEQKESVKKYSDEQSNKNAERFQKEIEMSKAEREALIKQLMNTTITPIEDRVVVYPDPPEAVTSGGIIIPIETNNQKRPSKGTVIAIGPGKPNPNDVSNFLLLNVLIALHAPQEQVDACKTKVQSLLAPPCKVGDRVMFGKFAGTPVNDPETDTELLIMRPSDIFVSL